MSLLYWTADQLTAVDAALDAARGGVPTVLLLEGAAGTGKSSLLDELVDRAVGFVVATSDGIESNAVPIPYGVLRDWGIELTDGMLGEDAAARATSELAAALDRLGTDGPVLWRLDDVQWADPESVEALRSLLRRLVGTPLLLALGRRTPALPGSPDIEDLVRPRFRQISLRLDGLAAEDAIQLIGSAHPDLAAGAALELWRHTGGNPLYLSSLLTEFDSDELDGLRGELPAPRAFTTAVERKLARLSTRAGDVLGATVVLGAGWSAVSDVAVVAEQQAPFEAVQELVDADLVHVRLTGQLSVRPAHALVGAAVRQLMSLPRRRELHRRAAGVFTGVDALDHRVAAAESYDDALAQEASRHAAALYEQWAHRQSAHYFRVARDLTPDPAERHALDLESQWCDVLATQAGGADRVATEVVGQDAVATSVAALHLVRGDQIGAATQRLNQLAADALQQATPITRYRIHLLTAYTRLVGGQSTARVTEALDAVDQTGVSDPALAPMASPTRGFVAARLHGDSAAIPTALAQLPDNPMDVPDQMLGLLGWRAVYRLHSLQVREAARDFEAMIDRSIGQRDSSPLQSQLVLARWYTGDWGLANVAQGLSTSTSPLRHWSPDIGGALLSSVWGRFDDADAQLSNAIAAVRRAPWPEGRLQLMVARVARVHAASRPPGEVAALAADYHDLAQLVEVMSGADGSILLHAGLLAHWSGRPVLARHCADLMEDAYQPSRSHRALIGWLRGLLALEAQEAQAVELLQTAAADDHQELPLYRAHSWADLAEALPPSRRSEALQARQRALEIYCALGASPYEERLAPLVAAPGPGETSLPTQTSAYLPTLTDRERDVLALLTKGLSYQQIAGQLFVTRSAVAYHLSNLYAKFGGRSRHDLTAYVRAHPAALRAS